MVIELYIKPALSELLWWLWWKFRFCNNEFLERLNNIKFWRISCHEVSHSLRCNFFCVTQNIQREGPVLSLVPAGLNPPLPEREHKVISSRLRLANASTLITKFTRLWSADWQINQYKSHNDWLLVQNWTYFPLQQGNMSTQWIVFTEKLFLWILLASLISVANRRLA
jgi:hypothetical protein